MAESQVVVAPRGVGARLSWLGKVGTILRRWPILPLLILGTLIFVGVTAPWIAPYDPEAPSLEDRNAPPFWYSEGGWSHVLGADHLGRDILSRIIYGARISLIIVAISITSGMVVGTVLGLLSGYFGGHVDEIITRLVDIWFALPFLLIALVVVIVFGQTFTVLMGLLALLAWPAFVRNVRADVLTLKTTDYVALARVAGASHYRILLRHIFPGVVSTVLVIASLRVGQLILAESILSFLGAGIPPPTPAWGVMVSDGRKYINDAWWLAFFPGLAILLVVMALNFLGDWLRDRLDPRLRQL